MSEGRLELRRIAAVLPRYGRDLGGGAEALTRSLILELLKQGLVKEVDVLTTCAKDHRTWENFYPAGQSIEDAVRVFRFPVDKRDVSLFLKNELAIARGERLPVEDQLAWMRESVNSRELYSALVARSDQYDLILFAPYLFATTFWGALIVKNKAVLIPCLHDEPYAYQEIVRYLFSNVRGVLFNAAPEEALARELYQGLDIQSAVVGMGFDPVRPVENIEAELARFGLTPGSYLLYSGRKEEGKNLPFLFSSYAKYRSSVANPVELILIGAGDVPFLSALPAGVRDLGFVDENTKRSLMAGALALCQPSLNESFSIVLMESWLVGTPALVHSRGVVTCHHVRSSQGGLYFGHPAEFTAVVQELVSRPELRAELGENGRRYVQTEYSWNAVTTRFMDGIRSIGLGRESANEQRFSDVSQS